MSENVVAVNEISPSYSLNKAIPQGYKHTEAGIIPDDWETKPLRAVLSKGRLGGNYPNQATDSGFPLMKMGNLDRGSFDTTKKEYVTSGVMPEDQHRLKYGDVLFNTRNTLDLVGKVAIWRDELPLAYYNSNLLRLEFDFNEVASPEYANYALNTTGSVSRLRALATGTTSVAAIYTRDLLDLPFIVPPVGEQRAIATALSDVDALLEELDRLIAKKRNIKQATMQQLLTGQTRLPGSEGEWETVTLGDLCRITTGRKDVNEGNPDGQYPFFTCSRTHTYSDSYSFDTEAILIAGNGEVGNLNYYNGQFEAYQRTYVLSNFSINPRYTWHFLSAYLSEYLGLGKIGSSIPYIKKENLTGFQIRKPKIHSELDEISMILDTIDTEMKTLVMRHEKVHAIKNAMMQELLTGRTRLI